MGWFKSLFATRPVPTGPLACSFCSKAQADVRKLIAGPTVYICDSCVDAATRASGVETSATLCCSFCGKARREVEKLVAGPTVYICNECLDLCRDIIAEEIDRGELPRK